MRQLLRRWFVAVALSALVLVGARPGVLLAEEPAHALVADRPPAYVVPADCEPPLPVHLFGDPLLDRPDMPSPGPFFNVDANILQVRFRNQLTNTVSAVPGRTDTISFAGNPFDWTVSPRIEVGWRLADGYGEFQLGYRFVATSGSDTQITPLGVADQHGRFNFNEFDLTYVSREFSLEPLWSMKWSLGARGATLFYDSHLAFVNPAPLVGTTLTQGESNYVNAYGPLAGLELSRKTGQPGLEIVAKVEAADLFGRIKQSFSEQIAGTPPAAGLTSDRSSVGVPTLSGMIGVSYTLSEWNHSRFLLGYQRETWWQIGRLNDSRGQLDMQGIFLRAEFNY